MLRLLSLPLRQSVLAVFPFALFAVGCESPPATPITPAADVSEFPPPPTPPTPRPASAADSAPVATVPTAPPETGNPVHDNNAADLAAMKSALERAARRVGPPAPTVTEPGAPDEAQTAEPLSEGQIAAAREALPALQERMQQVIPRYFDAESLRRLLTEHPEFRKD